MGVADDRDGADKLWRLIREYIPTCERVSVARAFMELFTEVTETSTRAGTQVWYDARRHCEDEV